MCRRHDVGRDSCGHPLLAPAPPHGGPDVPLSRSRTLQAGGGSLQHRPRSVGAVAASLPASSWYQRTVSEGTKGPITYAFARQRVTLCKDGLPERTVWLVIKRTLGTEPTDSYYTSNAPVSTPLRTFVWLSGIRWAVEQCFEEG